MKRFSLIIPCYKNSSLLPRCIASIKDQDWANKEIIVILDGKDEAAENVLKTHSDIIYRTVEHGGAPRARNIGAELASGDYLQFLDSDMFLYPGSLRIFAEAFEEHPDCGFVYGGYKFAESGYYPSEEFDPYFLEINNYIDGNFPMRKEVFPQWDADCKSLQDWDMWLRIVKKGVKGLYIKDQYFFEKADPKTGSISWDSHTHWLERKKYVQDKLGLPKRDICIASIAAPHHAKRIAKMLNYDYCDEFHLWNKQHEYKAVVLLGWFPGNSVENAHVFMDLSSGTPKRRDIKRFVYWIGTDSLQYGQMPIGHFVFKENVDAMNKEYIHFCQPLIEKELKNMGFDVKSIPLPVEVNRNDIAIPKDFTVAIYDHGQNDIYNAPIMESIIKAMPDVKFVVFGNPRQVGDSGLPNLKFLGHKPINDIIAQSSALLRITKHDGYPVTPVEFLCAGRVTITNQDMPFTIKVDIDLLHEKGVVDGKKDIIKKIREIKKKYVSKEYLDEGFMFYQDQLNPDKLKKEIESRL